MAVADDPADAVNSMLADSTSPRIDGPDAVPVAYPGRDGELNGRARLPLSCKAESMKASLTH